MKAWMRYLPALVVLLLLWQGASLWLGEYVVPRVGPTLAYFVRGLATIQFWDHVLASFRRIGPGLVIAFGVAFPLGLALGSKKSLDRAISPLVFLTYPIPKIVFLPVLLTAMGLNDMPRVTLIALTAGYQILVVTRGSALGLEKQYVDSFRTLGGSPLQLLRHVLVPAVLPDGLTALRVACGTAVAVLFMVESFATSSGLGFLIMDAWGRGDLHEMFAGVIGMSVLGIVLYEGCNRIEHVVCRWRESSTF